MANTSEKVREAETVRTCREKDRGSCRKEKMEVNRHRQIERPKTEIQTEEA